DVARRFPQLRMESNALFVKDGKFYSSAGVTAGIDLALALIEEDFGSKVALAVAREMVVYLKRSGGQEQYSEPLKFQTHASDRFAEPVTWMMNNPLVRFFENFRQDIAYGARGLVRNPGYAAIVVATLALGIGANTAIFSVVHGVLLRRLPYRAPEQLVLVHQAAPKIGDPSFG